MSGKGTLIGVFGALVVAAALIDGQPTPGAPTTPAPAAPTVLDAAGHSVAVWVAFLVAGLIVGVVYAVASGTLVDRYPALRWTIWSGLAASTIAGWVIVGQFAAWFNAVTGLVTTMVTVLVVDLMFGGRTVNFPGRSMPQRDESWRDVIPQSVVLRNDGPGSEAPRTPTWRDLERMDWDLRSGVSAISLARSWKVEPDEIVLMVRDFRLAQDRWEDTLNGRTPQAPAPTERDLSEEIRDTGWDAFLAATPARLVHQAPDPGHPGADAVLYEITSGPWTGERVLQVIDASPEDGINHRVGIPVGRDHTDAGTALADTWGLDLEQYQPLRHT